ncbi:MAG TPA: hypothetical protein VGB53_13780 [Rubricoccaceae bacterium]|jgi:hypothetical protein
MTRSVPRLWPALTAVLAGVLALAACDSAATDATATASLAADEAYYKAGSLDPADSLVARLTRGLSLTDAQVALTTAELATVEPGDAWRLAAALNPTLTDAQRAALDTLALRGSGRGPRGHRAPGGGRDSTCAGSDSTHTHADSTRFTVDWAAVRAAELAARNTALGLSDAEATALDSVLADLRAAHIRTSANVVPDAVAALLSDVQEQVYLVHSELRAYLRLGHGPRVGHGGHGGHGGDHGGGSGH